MKVNNLGHCPKTGKQIYVIDASVKKYSKKQGRMIRTHIRRKVVGYQELQAKQTEIEKITGGSLNSVNFSECVELALSKNNGAGQIHVYQRIQKELDYPVNENFVYKAYDYIDTLRKEGKASNTILNHISCLNFCLRYANMRGVSTYLPIIHTDLKRQFRDRVWTKEERDRFFNEMILRNSHIYWIVWLCEKRPIRKGDALNLAIEDLVLVGRNTPYLRYRAQKTSKRVPRDTFIPLADLEGLEGLLQHFRENEKSGRLFPLGNFKRHWNYLCNKAKIEDFHFHDLKHCAVTFMINAGYTFQDLADLNIQHIQTAQRVYYHYDAEKVLDKTRTFRAPEQGELTCEAL